MKCPSCGRLDFEGNEICPRCGEEIPPGSGEFSGTSSPSMEAPAIDKKPGQSSGPGPLFHRQSPTDEASADEPIPDDDPARDEKSDEAADSAGDLPEPEPEDDTESAEIEPSPDEPEPEDDEESADGKADEEIEPPEDDEGSEDEPEPESEPDDEEPDDFAADEVEKEFSGGEKYLPEHDTPVKQTTKPGRLPLLKSSESGSGGRDRPEFKEGGSTVPEPYGKGRSTGYSAEFSTDWIEKYARSNVISGPGRAGFGMRMWGFFTDWMLLVAMGVILLLAGRLMITILDGKSLAPMVMMRQLALPTGAVWLVVVLIYFTVFTAFTGQTPGKAAMDMRVVGPNGYPPSIGKSFIRSVVYLAGMIPLGLGFWWALTNDERYTWHDMAAGTKVISVFQKGG